MNLDDPICLCFHVSRRKVVNFIRVEKPRRASQLSQCFGAGTGCGWCRPYLEKMLASQNLPAQSLDPSDSNPDNTSATESVSIEEYREKRSQYIRDGGGQPPPGAPGS